MLKKWTLYDSAPEEFKKYIILFWKLVVAGLALLFLIFLLAGVGAFGKMPTFDRLENPESNLATQIIGVDGKLIGTFADKNRTPIHYRDLPQNLVDALISTEDERFYKHSGIDFKGTMRALLTMGKGGGASTITQQLAKMQFTRKPANNILQRIIQKFKEIVIAVRLERRYSKNELLAMYLNEYDFLNQAVGIRSASRIYFGKEPEILETKESAMLVGMLKNSSLFNPLRREEMVRERRNVVLGQMLRNNKITKELKDSLQQTDLDLNIHRESHKEGMAPYFREYLRQYMTEWIKDHKKTNGDTYDLYRDGLKIYVTMDSRMQQYAEEAMQEHMANLQRAFFNEQKNNKTAPFLDISKDDIEKTINRAMRVSERWRKMKEAGKSEKEIKASFDEPTEMRVFSWKGDIDTTMTPRDSILYYKHFLRAGFMAIEPQTGHIKVWVGGIDYRHFMFDAVKQQKRQVGSTFKPFVYATAINQLRKSPCDKYPNTLYTIPKGKYHLGEDWTPKNADNSYGGERTLKDALANSINVITARLVDEVTPNTVVELAKRAGIESELTPVPSIGLGTLDLSLYELISAYSNFANKGQRIEPMAILSITDKNGTVLQTFVPKTNEVISEESAYVMLELMKGVTQHGSGVRLRSNWTANPDGVVTGHPYKFTNPIAGKTGTTQNQSDGWFIGIVPNLAAGAWVGGEDRSTHFRSLGKGQGASMALPIWALFMKKCYADSELNVSDQDFEKPNRLTINLDCSKHALDSINVDEPIENIPDIEF